METVTYITVGRLALGVPGVLPGTGSSEELKMSSLYNSAPAVLPIFDAQ